MQPLLQHCKRALLTYRYAFHSTLPTPSAAALQKKSADPLGRIKQNIITDCSVPHPMHMAESQHAIHAFAD